jgi:hypothetical protein
VKRVALFITLLICCATSLSYALPPEFSSTRTLPPKGYGDVPVPSGVLVGGDTPATATVIPGLPYADAGSTCGYNDDYTPSCMFSTSPDVFYRFTPATNMCVTISLCNSLYDTGLAVYNSTTSTEIACNDDNCALQSRLTAVNLVAGNVYFIIVDGYSTSCGQYSLSVTQCPPPPQCNPCPVNGVLEGEPVCSDGYVDTFNAGCNSTPATFVTLPCDPNLTICGTYGTFNTNNSRDTDWYQFTLTGAAVINVSVTGTGLTGSALAIVDNLCAPNVLCGQFTPSAQCANVTCSAALVAGTYRIFVASFFDSTPCNSAYTLVISGLACPTAVPTSSWGRIKQIYR